MKSLFVLFFGFTILVCGGENLINNGSFEEQSLKDLYIRQKSKTPEKLRHERSAMKAKTGKHSLCFTNEGEAGSYEINFNRLPFKGAVKYRFSAHYYLQSSGEKSGVSGRVIFMDKNKKVLRYLFPKGDKRPGQWNTINLEFYPPAGTAKITVTLWLSGKMELYLDDLYFGVVKEENLTKIKSASTLLYKNNDLTIWSEAPYLKVPYSAVPKDMKEGKAVELSAAINEVEPFQVVVNSRLDLGNITLDFSDLTGKSGIISKANYHSRVVEFVNLKTPDNPAMKGWNADPILNTATAKSVKNRNLPFYVQLKVPENAKSGVYQGKISVRNQDKILSTFPIKLSVRNFALPDTPALNTYFYGRATGFQGLDTRPAGEITADMMTMLKNLRINGNQAIRMPNPKWKIENNSLIVTDWSKFDERVKEFHEKYQMINFPVPFFGMMGDNFGWFGIDRSKPGKSPFGKFPWLSPQGLKYAGEFAKQFCDHVQIVFPDLKFNAYIYDEPPEKVHQDLAKITNALHQAAPDLRIFIPKQVNNSIGYVKTFCVPMTPGFVNLDLHKTAMAQGKEIWFYNWRMKLDNFDYIRNRLYSWQIYAADGIGGLLWNTVQAPKNINPWLDFDKTYRCGSATIFYPPRKAGETMSSSLRAEQIRESIDDFDYLTILEKKINSKFPAQGKKRLKELLYTLIPSIPFGFNNDPHLLYALRDQIATEIENFDIAPVALVTSSLPPNGKTELSEVTLNIFAPAGSTVEINRKSAGIIPVAGNLKINHSLDKIGRNSFDIQIISKNRQKHFIREYIRQPDPQLKVLAQLVKEAQNLKIPTDKAQKFQQQLSAGAAYTAQMHKECSALIEELKLQMVKVTVDNRKTFANSLEKGIFERGKSAFNRKQFDRAQYYLKLAESAGSAGDMSANKVAVKPVEFKGHPGFELSNGLITATVLETGGRLISFKVRSVETLAPGSFDRGLPLEQRAAKAVTQDMVTKLHGYGGYEDAGGGRGWPISFVDWDVKLSALTKDQAAITFETKLPGTPFFFSRRITMRANSSTLRMDYEIKNTMPEDSASDDPEHYQLEWRGRFVPAIGWGKLPQQNDQIILPGKIDPPLPETRFDSAKPAMYERRSIRLEKPFLGVFDPIVKRGIVIKGSDQITHGYIWFNSKGNHKGEAKVYTLEFPRSFYGKKFDDPQANSPLTVKPGKTLTFSLTIQGISGATTESGFRSAIR